jgi:hypothetical protein
MDERMMELVHRAFDGECSEQERAELTTALESDPELQNFQARLHELDEHLQSIPEEEVPDELRPAILDNLRDDATSDLRHAPRGHHPSRRRDFMFFVVGAAAMFLVALGLRQMPQPGLDGGNTVGTLLPTETVHSQSILLSGETLGELRWADSQEGTLFELRWTAETPAQLELEIDPAAPTLLRVRSEGREATIPLVGGEKPGR